jgi:hypothetical protein
MSYQRLADGTFPVRVIREGPIYYCYSAEVDAHMRGDCENCYHSSPLPDLDERRDTKRELLVRNLEIARAYNRGVSKADLARRFDLTRSRINQIIERWTIEGDDQGDDDDDEGEEP